MRQTLLLLITMALAVLLAAGVAYAVEKNCQANTDCFGTNQADTLNGSDGNDFMFGRGGPDLLRGFSGDDEMRGQGGADQLFGASGYDLLNGGGGNDGLSGGGAENDYFFGPNWGIDSITDSTTSADRIFFRSDIDGGVIVTDNLIIDLRTGEGPEARTAGGTNRINWEDTFNDVISGNGDDQITGNAAGNLITGSGGADTMVGGGGDDQIGAIDGSTTDTVNCGAGDNDEVRFQWLETNGMAGFQDSDPIGQVNGGDDEFDEYNANTCEDPIASQID
jgi:RTX calcium-binding nonapeptide repeat (4 copies)